MTALNYDALMAMPPVVHHHTYTARDTMLYALGLGAASRDPLDADELKLTCEKDLVALPTMTVVMGGASHWIADPKFGIDYVRLLHGEQSLIMERVLPVAGTICSTTSIEAIYDKGEDKGAVLSVRREMHDDETGELVATIRQAMFLRSNGGFGGKSDGAPVPHPVPDRGADLTVDMPTRTDQALLYRLSGDYNPLHSDPEVARKAGFEKPILHGLCSYGIAARAAIRHLCDADPARLRRFDVRFSSPVQPGDTLRIEFWNEAAGRAAWRVRALERDIAVLQNGYMEFTR